MSERVEHLGRLADYVELRNPRFAAYAHAHGRSPEEQLKADHDEYPGGCMCGFIVWLAQQKRAFRAAHPEAFHVTIDAGHVSHVTLDLIDHAAFDRFLGIHP